MTNKINILLKSVTLLYVGHLHNKDDVNKNGELVRELIESLPKGKGVKLIGGDNEIRNDLVVLIKSMINDIASYDIVTLSQSVGLILNDKRKACDILLKALSKDYSDNAAMNIISSCRKLIYKYIKNDRLRRAVSKAAMTLNTTDSTIMSDDTLSGLLDELTILRDGGSESAILCEMDVKNGEDFEDGLRGALTSDGKSNLVCDWKDVNKMFDFISGSMLVIAALRHNYKSGFTQSLICQLAMYNKPEDRMVDKSKKPLLVYLSCEDSASIFTWHMYKYIYTTLNGRIPERDNLTARDIQTYLMEHLTKNGYSVKLLHIDPNDWSYRDLFDKVNQYIADGYEIHAWVTDYLDKLNKDGCLKGVSGLDTLDLFTKVRNFFTSKKIFNVTPHQISSDAKQLLINGINPMDFVKALEGKGYTDGCRRIDQVADLMCYMHIAYDEETKLNYLTIQWDKSRGGDILENSEKYCKLRFRGKLPLLGDSAHEPLDVESVSTLPEDLF